MDEWTPDDEFDPCYCVECKKHIPRAVSARQGVCDACAAKRKALVKATPPPPQKAGGKLARRESTVPAPARPAFDTHIGVCQNCGSRNLVIEGWESPFGDAIGQGFKRFAGRFTGMPGLPMEQDGAPDWSRLHIEPDTEVRCRDCMKRWKWKDRKANG